METAARYLATIESLMVENSRLTKELNNAIEGKLPSRIIPQEDAEKCFAQIAEILGPSARGGIVEEVSLLCNEFKVAAQEYIRITDIAKQLDREKKALEQAVKGDDVEQNYSTPLIAQTVRLHAVLEVIKTRLDRLALSGDSEIMELRKNVADFLSGASNE